MAGARVTMAGHATMAGDHATMAGHATIAAPRDITPSVITQVNSMSSNPDHGPMGRTDYHGSSVFVKDEPRESENVN